MHFVVKYALENTPASLLCTQEIDYDKILKSRHPTDLAPQADLCRFWNIMWLNDLLLLCVPRQWLCLIGCSLQSELQVFVKRVSNVKTFGQQFDEYAYLEMTIQNYCSVEEKGLTRFYIIISYHVWEADTLERESFASFHGITRISLREFEIFFIGPTTIRYALWNNNYLGCYILTFFYYHQLYN